MRTPILTGLSITLLTAGISLGAIGLHPALPGSLIMRCGVILCMASIPPWHAACSRRAADRVNQHDADTYNAGYLDGLADVRRGLLDPSPDAGPGHHTHDSGHHIVRHLRPLPSTYRAPERKAQ
jgi:hypothetical protein